MKNFDSYCLTDSEKDEIDSFDKIHKVFGNRKGNKLIPSLANFPLSELREYLYNMFSERYAYSIIERVQLYKINNPVITALNNIYLNTP